MAQEAQVILDEVDRRLYQHRHGKATAEQALRIGSFEVFTTYFLGELLEREKLQIPLTVLELTPGHLEEALENNQIDLGITYMPVPRASLDFVKVAAISMEVYAAASSAYAKEAPATWPFAVPVTPVVGAATRVLGLDGWPDHQHARRRKYQVTMMETGLELARRGLAVIYLPTFIADLHNRTVSDPFKLVRLPKPRGVGDTKQSVYVVRRKSAPEDRLTRQIARCLKRVCKAD